MSKFNTGATRPAATSAINVTGTATTRTYEGAPGYVREVKGELFQLAITNMVGEDTFYEKAGDRDNRFRELVQQVSLSDPDWMAKFITWLRRDANMRSASGVAAMEMARAWQVHAKENLHALTASERSDAVADVRLKDTTRFNARGPIRRAIVGAAARADEPGEMLAYWLGRYGRNIPKSAKRGLGDAAITLYTQRNLLKYDTGKHDVRFGDVLELCHPSTDDPTTQSLFRYAIDRRHGHDMRNEDAAVLHTIARNIGVRRIAMRNIEVLLDPERLRNAGMTWEDVLSLAGNKLHKGTIWDAVIPSMGYMALLRNLRNFDEARISPQLVKVVKDRLSNPDEVIRSRQFPFRFMSAYQNVDSVRWSETLEEALNHSCMNIPDLPGKTLVLVDTSASMNMSLSQRGTMSRAVAGALFGAVLATRCQEVDLIGFANGHRPFRIKTRTGASVLKTTEEIKRRIGEDGHGTDIYTSVKKTFSGHDRVIVITDLQTTNRHFGGSTDPSKAVPVKTPLYAFNTAGYQATPFDTRDPYRHEFGGLTDSAFKLIPLLERGADTGWPWDVQGA